MDFNARFYSPRLGRFTQPDTIIPGMSSQSYNRYSYVNNNPIMMTDPNGHRPTSGCEAGSGDHCGGTQPPPPKPQVKNPSVAATSGYGQSDNATDSAEEELEDKELKEYFPVGYLKAAANTIAQQGSTPSAYSLWANGSIHFGPPIIGINYSWGRGVGFVPSTGEIATFKTNGAALGIGTRFIGGSVNAGWSDHYNVTDVTQFAGENIVIDGELGLDGVVYGDAGKGFTLSVDGFNQELNKLIYSNDTYITAGADILPTGGEAAGSVGGTVVELINMYDLQSIISGWFGK